MKKIFLTVIVVLLAVTTVSAQYKGDWGVGPKIGVYTNAGADGAIFGIGAAGQYSITDNWRVAPSILALCKTGCSVDISADVQYLFNIAPTGISIRWQVSAPTTSATGRAVSTSAAARTSRSPATGTFRPASNG